MEGACVAARPGLVASSCSGGPSEIGSSVGATSATAGRQRKPGRWKRIPRYAPTRPIPTANPTLSPKVLPPPGTTDFAPLLPSFGSILPAGEPRETGETRHQPDSKAFVVALQKVPKKVAMMPTQTVNPVMLFPKGLPPPGTKDFRPYLPSFYSSLPVGEPRESGETRHQLPPRHRLGAFDVAVVQKGSKEEKASCELNKKRCLESMKQLEEKDEDLYDTEEQKVAFRAFKTKYVSFYHKLATTSSEDVVLNYIPPSDTQEEHLTAEEMEMEAGRRSWPVCPQAKHFATLALDHYNSTKHKFEMSRVLLSKCFSEVDDTTYAHVNFTATTPEQSASHPAKRLFFAELMLIPGLLADESAEPMRVLNVCTIDDSCFGGCHEMVRDIKGPVRKDMDYDRCHACSERIKHPRGVQFIGGHNRTRMPYFGVSLD